MKKNIVFLIILLVSTSCTTGEEVNKINYSLFAGNGVNHQSIAAYGDYAIFVTDRRSKFSLYNLKTKELICEKECEAVNEKIGDYYLYHCNQAAFGVSFYEKEDPFPLLYISQRARSDRRSFVEVYRLKLGRETSESDFSSLDAEKVQTIFFPAMTENNALGRVNCVIDNQTGEMYTYSYSTIDSDINYGKCRISSFAIPDYEEKEVYLEDIDILDSYILDYNAVNSQGACISNRMLFIGQGYFNVGYIYLNVVDLRQKRLYNRINLFANDITWEPEGCFVYGNSILIGSGNNLWEFPINEILIDKNHSTNN